MKNYLFHSRDCLIYPGEYVPTPETEAYAKKLKKSHKESAHQLPLNMDELEDCFRIEVSAPGSRRENFFIYILENILSIIVFQKQHSVLKKEQLKIHEFDKDCMERHILLPVNADAEFSSATYREGILTLYLPKSKEPFKTNIKQLIVY